MGKSTNSSTGSPTRTVLQKFGSKKIAALELCERFGISLSSAYRHCAAGTTPSGDRCIRADGKAYPKSIKPPSQRQLRICISTLQKAKAYPVNRELMTRIYELAGSMLSQVEVTPVDKLLREQLFSLKGGLLSEAVRTDSHIPCMEGKNLV
jgi:hypothetical protein